MPVRMPSVWFRKPIATRTTLVISEGRSEASDLAEGKLVGDGVHSDLIRDSELYRHLNYVRFNSFSSPD